MSTDINLKALWSRQHSIVPDIQEITAKTIAYKKQSLQKIIRANLLLLLTSAFILFIWYHYQPERITTKIGIVLMVLCMLLYLVVYNSMIPLLMKTDYSNSSNEYLQQLLKLQARQLFLQTTIMNGYFILLSAGLFLYMLEYAGRMHWPAALACYVITFAWIAFNWFYVRPKTIHKQQAKLQELIGKYELLNKQLLHEQQGI